MGLCDQHFRIFQRRELPEFKEIPIDISDELRVIHFSDLHGKWDVNNVCLEIARAHPEVDALILTGDVCDIHQHPVSAQWDDVPQRFRGIVRGNHEINPDSCFRKLGSWVTSRNWIIKMGRFGLIGLDSGVGPKANIDKKILFLCLTKLRAQMGGVPPQAVIFASHNGIGVSEGSLCAELRKMGWVQHTNLVFLRGHRHDREQQFSEKTFGSTSAWESHVISCKKPWAPGFLITISGESVIAQDLEVPPIEHFP